MNNDKKNDIIEWNSHVHSKLLVTNGHRDFHKLVIEIYNKIPENEKKLHLKKFNSLIETWHYQPAEAWASSVWIPMTNYLMINFTDLEKYNDIIKIWRGEN